MELTLITFKSRKNTRIRLYKSELKDNILLTINITKLISKKDRKAFKDFEIIRKFSKALLITHNTYLSELSFNTIFLFMHCKTMEEFEELTKSKSELEVAVRTKEI